MYDGTYAIEQLVATDAYSTLLQLRPQFDLFAVLGSHLGENATSRAIAFLADSSREHGLGNRFFDAWIRQIHKEGFKNLPHRLTIQQLLSLRGDGSREQTLGD